MGQIKKASVDNIKNDLENLAKYNSTPGDGITRVLFYEEELKSYTVCNLLSKSIAKNTHIHKTKNEGKRHDC